MFAGAVKSLAVVQGSCVSLETVPNTIRPTMKSAASSAAGHVSHVLMANELPAEDHGIA